MNDPKIDRKNDPKNLHFTKAELEARVGATIAAMEREGLSALVMFRQESMYWLTGYDTFGYVHFQAMVLTADGRLVLLTRSADRLQAAFTSTVEDVRIWRDREAVSYTHLTLPTIYSV